MQSPTLAAIIFALLAPSEGATLVGVEGSGSRLWDIDPSTFTVSNLRSLGIGQVCGMAAQPGAPYLYIVSDPTTSGQSTTLFRYNLLTSELGLVGVTTHYFYEGGFAFNPQDGRLFGVGVVSAGVFELNLVEISITDGTSQVIGAIGTSGDHSAAAFTPEGRLFVLDNGNDALLEIDSATAGVIRSLPISMAMDNWTYGMDYDSDSGQLLFSYDYRGLYHALFQLDQNTGQVTELARRPYIGSTFSGLAFVVPEPSVGVLLLALPFTLLIRNRREHNRLTSNHHG